MFLYDCFDPVPMIRINQTLSIGEEEFEERFIRASGPGGQHINKVSTAVQLRWPAAQSRYLKPDAVARLREVAGNRMTRDGILIITARRHRSQEQNRREARQRLIGLVRRALKEPKIRKKTRPTAAQIRQRLDNKRHRGQVKRLRQGVKAGGADS